MERFDLLSRVDLFGGMQRTALEQVAETATWAELPPEVTVISVGDVGDALYVIERGVVEVLTQSAPGTPPVRVALLGPGQWFGEMALLTGEPRSATVRTVEAARLLRIGRAEFARAASDPAVYQRLLSQLCTRLRGVEEQLEGAQTARQALGRHFHALHARSGDSLIGASEPAKKLRAAVTAAAQNDDHVLVLGPAGSGTTFVAALIARDSRRAEGPLIEVDCVGSGESAATDLFGAEGGVDGQRRLGALELCAEGTVVVEEPDALEERQRFMQALETGWFYRLGGAEPIRVRARIIVTKRTTGAKGETEDPEFVTLFRGGCVQVPTVRERRRDIEPLARALLERQCRSLGVPVPELTKGAIERLLSYPWPGNVEELSSVMRRAAALATEGQVEADHIVIHLPTVQPEARLDLFRVPLVAKFVRSRAYPLVLQLPTALILGAITYLCFFGPNDSTNLALALTWPVWWAMLPLTFILVGRIWCSICPFALVSSVVQKVCSLRLKVPQFFRKMELWPMAGLFVFLTWADEYWHYPDFPRMTGIVLVSVLAGTLFFSFLFERRVWCRYFCPLGGVNGVYSSASMVELRPSTDVCAGGCKGHECVAKDSALACPMLERPMVLDNNRSCNLCMNCVKVCPNNAVHLYVRYPGAEIWQLRQPVLSAGILALWLSGVMVLHGMMGCLEANGSGLGRLPVLCWVCPGNPESTWTISYFTTLGVMLLSALFVSAVSALIEGGRWKSNLAHYGLAFALLAVFFHVALEGATLVSEGVPGLLAILFKPLGGDPRPEAYALFTPLLTLFVQMGVAAVGTYLTIHALRRISRQRQEDGMSPGGAIPHILMAGTMGLFFLGLLWSTPVTVWTPTPEPAAAAAAPADTGAATAPAGQPAPSTPASPSAPAGGTGGQADQQQPGSDQSTAQPAPTGQRRSLTELLTGGGGGVKAP